MEDSILSITRPREWYGRFRKLNVLVDGETAAGLGSGKAAELIVKPGAHILQVKMDWCTSRELHIDVRPGERLAFVTRSPGVWKASKVMRTNPGSFFEVLSEET